MIRVEQTWCPPDHLEKAQYHYYQALLVVQAANGERVTARLQWLQQQIEKVEAGKVDRNYLTQLTKEMISNLL